VFRGEKAAVLGGMLQLQARCRRQEDGDVRSMAGDSPWGPRTRAHWLVSFSRTSEGNSLRRAEVYRGGKPSIVKYVPVPTGLIL